MSEGLNASGYTFVKDDYQNEFEKILSKIITCYRLMLVNSVTLSNDENSIRDVLLINYLKNNSIRNKIGLTDYLFDREVPEDATIGRTDIKIQTLNSFTDTSAYYLIECKRLNAINPNGSTGLNAKYIESGMYRFTSKTYSTHYKTNGMIGFIIEPININQNVNSINNLLKTIFKKANTVQELKYRELFPEFNFSYSSIHRVDGNDIVIYHLMLDFSKQIK